MKSITTCILLLVCIILSLSIVQVAVSNRLTTTGLELDKVSSEIKTYQRENAILSEKLVDKSSLTHIASAAGTLGFVESKSQLFIHSAWPVALR